VRIGILGCGHVSDQYFHGIRQWDFLEVTACADLDPVRAREKAAQHEVRATSPEELLADDEIDLVVNLTPPLAHAETSLRIIDAGKHVWSEKPLAAELESACAVVDAAAAAGVRVGCAPDTFLGGSIQTSVKLVDDGWIGRPLSAVAFVSEPGYEHFHPEVESFYARGAGPVLDLGPYYLTALVAMLGPVSRVTAFAGTGFAERTVRIGPRRGSRIAVEVPTHVTGALEFGAGVLATVLMSWDIWTTNLPYLELYGDAGSLSVPNPDEFHGEPRLRRAGAEELVQPPPPPGTLPWFPVPLFGRGDVGRGIGIAELATAIAEDRPHRATGELAYHVLEVLSGLQRSAVERRDVTIASRCERPAPLYGDLFVRHHPPDQPIG
jgi:predicted dehydrogenase